jgi:hypothetical protein
MSGDTGPDFVALRARGLEAVWRFYPGRLGGELCHGSRATMPDSFWELPEADGATIVQRSSDCPLGSTFSFVKPCGYTVTVNDG